VLSVLLLQIVPGKEREAASALESSSFVYEGLGKYDLLAITEESGSLFLNERESFLNKTKGRFPAGTLDWMSVCGFKWSPNKKATKRVRGNTIIGICCIKLNLEDKTSPLKQEVGLIEKIYERLDDVHVYSGLGYYEILCLIERETIGDLSVALDTIKNVAMIDDKHSTIMDVNTIPCIRFIDIDKADLVKEEVEATIAINLKTGIPLNIDDILGRSLGNSGHQIFGFHDMIVSTKMPLRDLLLNILDVRYALANSGLYSTCTLVKHEGTKVNVVPVIPWPERKTEETNLKIDEKTPVDLVYYNDLYSVMKKDPYTCHLVRNLSYVLEKESEFHNQAYEYLRDGEIKKYGDHIRTFNTVLDLITAIMQQRLNGVLFGNLLGGKGVTYEAVGGIQRLIYALEAIPGHILSALGVRWKGLCLFGHCHSFRSWFTHEILAMPREYMLRPEKYWGMNHEAGHIVFLRLDEENAFFNALLRKLYEENKSSIKKRIQENSKEGKNEETQENEVQEDEIVDFYNYHYSDVFSDLVDFSYGFKGDWNLYRNTIRDYLFEQGALNYHHVGRALVVYRTVGPGSSVSMEQADKDFFDDLETWLGRKNKRLESTLRGRALLFADEMQPAASIFGDYMRRALVKMDLVDIDKKTKTIDESFAEGHVVIDADPTLLLKSLLSNDITAKARFSAILSLYDCGSRCYLDP
jgi:hypothetical protein